MLNMFCLAYTSAYPQAQPWLTHALAPRQAESLQGLPQALYRLLDPGAAVELPPCANLPPLDNRELDKLVAGLGRSKATWRRALMLHQWLQASSACPVASCSIRRTAVAFTPW